MRFYNLFGLIVMDVVEYLSLSAKELKGKEDDNELYLDKVGLNLVLLIMGVGLVACLGIFRMFWKHRRMSCSYF